MTPLTELRSVSHSHAARLESLGIRSIERLLQVAQDRRDRSVIAEETGISEVLLFGWVQLADLMQIRGIGCEYAELLFAADIRTPRHLSRREPERLYQQLARLNGQEHLVKRLPSPGDVRRWVIQAAKKKILARP